VSDIPRIGPDSGPFDMPGQDETVVALRGALSSSGQVTPSPDGLQRIQREINAGRGRRRRSWIGQFTPALTAAAAVAVLAVAGAIAVRLAQPTTPAGGPAQPAATSTATAEARRGMVPVYVVGEQGGQHRLFREYRDTSVTAKDDRVADAVTAAVNHRAQDPDYDIRLFEGGPSSRATATVSKSLITVTLTAAMVSRDGVGKSEAELAVQQVVWTATAAAAADVAAGESYADTPVRIQVDRGRQSMFGVLPLDRDFRRAAGEADPRAPIWIISLVEGADVGHLPRKVEGDAALGDGGSVSWSLTRNGIEVDSGQATLTKAAGPRTGWECRPATQQRGMYVLTVTLHQGSGVGPSSSTGDWQDTRKFFVR
jgi:hypothetical protein